MLSPSYLVCRDPSKLSRVQTRLYGRSVCVTVIHSTGTQLCLYLCENQHLLCTFDGHRTSGGCKSYTNPMSDAHLVDMKSKIIHSLIWQFTKFGLNLALYHNIIIIILTFFGEFRRFNWSQIHSPSAMNDKKQLYNVQISHIIEAIIYKRYKPNKT